MPVYAKLRYLRIAPRKVRLAADLIRGKSAEEAQTILNFTVKKASQPLLKLLKSAINNAKHNFQLEESNLFISKIIVDEGPKYKRWMPRARGSASEIQKKTSHITLVLGELIKPPEKIKEKKIPKKLKIEKPLITPVKEIKKDGEAPKIEKITKRKPEKETIKPRIEKGTKRVFRRKAF